MSASRIVSPADGGFALRPAPVPPAEFPFAAELGEFGSIEFRTTGFEGYDIDLPPEIAAEPARVQVEPVPPVVTAPVEIITPPARISIFEPLEIMDYEEFEPQEYSEPEPEPEPPAFVAQALPVAVAPAAPGAAKQLPVVGALPYPEAEPVLVDANLSTIRPKILRGPDPNAKAAVPAPAPEPEPAVVIEPPKPVPAPVPDKPKVSVRPAPPPPDKDRRQRPAIAARDRGNAVPVEREEPQAAPAPPPPPPAPKPKVMPMPSRRPETAPAPEPVVAPAAARIETGPVIGLPATEAGGMSNGLKMAIAGAVLAALGAGGYFTLGGKSAKPVVSTEGTPSSLIIGGGGWTTTWGNDAAVNKNKQISIYRPSMAMTDYRFEFRGQIDRKALGWIFRASNSKNYYVMKLETIKPGANPLVALVKYAVVDGKETTRTQVMLPFQVKIDTLYQVRLDVNGDKFSTYVQGKLVDFWTDGRIKVGGAGFYNDAGERASIKSSQLSYLSAAGAQ